MKKWLIRQWYGIMARWWLGALRQAQRGKDSEGDVWDLSVRFFRRKFYYWLKKYES